jgi:hypothetical protein
MKKFIPVVVVLVAGVASVWKIVECLSCVADFGRDGLLINWIINTAGRNLYGLYSVGWRHIFDGNIFYPYSNVLAYSDMFFLTASWSYIWGKLLHDPGIVSGLVLIVGQVATMLMTYVWWMKISGNRWAAAVMSVAFGVSQIRFHYQVHMQMWSMQFVLLAMFWIHDWIVGGRKWKLYAGFGLLGLQVWESLLPVFFAGLFLTVWAVVYRKDLVNRIRLLVTAVFLAMAVASPPLWAYWNISHNFDYHRSVRDAAHNAMSVDDLVGKFVSPGVFLITASLLLFFVRRKTVWQSNAHFKWLFAVAIISLIMALGPVLKWSGETVKIFDRFFVPMPYGLAYYIIPGFGALRTPSRWIWIFGWCLSGLTALGLGKAFNYTKVLRFVTVICFVLFAFFSGTSINTVRVLNEQSSRSRVYKWLVVQPGKVVLELPMVNDDSQTEAMVSLLETQKYLANGYSGFYPPERSKFGNMINSTFPNSQSIEELKRLGVDWVVIDKDRFIFSGKNLIPERISYEDEHWVVVKVI